MPTYSTKQKEAVVRKLLLPNSPSALALSKQIGISQGTISRWLREYTNREDIHMAKRPLDWTPEERFQTVMETNSLSADELGLYVRKKGITLQQLKEWKADCIQAMGGRPGRKPDKEKRDLKRQIKELERDIRKKDKALAETAALLVLKKKSRRSGGTTRTIKYNRRTNFSC